jgi:hypothetical protein
MSDITETSIPQPPSKYAPEPTVKKRQSDTPKISVALKRLWHAACFQPRDRKGSGRVWRKAREGAWMPLKKFAAQNKELATAWIANKLGATESERSEANIARIAAERTASRAARGK